MKHEMNEYGFGSEPIFETLMPKVIAAAPGVVGGSEKSPHAFDLKYMGAQPFVVVDYSAYFKPADNNDSEPVEDDNNGEE